MAVVRNFLNYVLHHNVCPEYSEQVNAARAVCDRAQAELHSILRASARLPGDFNTACSTLYGGSLQGLYSGDQEWARGIDLTLGMSETSAKEIGMAGLSAYGSEWQVEQALNGLHRIRSEEASLEITEIVSTPPDILGWYEDEVAEHIKPLGRFKARSWTSDPFLSEEDGTDDDESGLDGRMEREGPSRATIYEFWLEQSIVVDFFVGMKIKADVHHLGTAEKGDTVLAYFDTIIGLYPSFFTFLPSEMMAGWKEPGPAGSAEGETREEGWEVDD